MKTTAPVKDRGGFGCGAKAAQLSGACELRPSSLQFVTPNETIDLPIKLPRRRLKNIEDVRIQPVRGLGFRAAVQKKDPNRPKLPLDNRR